MHLTVFSAFTCGHFSHISNHNQNNRTHEKHIIQHVLIEYNTRNSTNITVTTKPTANLQHHHSHMTVLLEATQTLTVITSPLNLLSLTYNKLIVLSLTEDCKKSSIKQPWSHLLFNKYSTTFPMLRKCCFSLKLLILKSSAAISLLPLSCSWEQPLTVARAEASISSTYISRVGQQVLLKRARLPDEPFLRPDPVGQVAHDDSVMTLMHLTAQ